MKMLTALSCVAIALVALIGASAAIAKGKPKTFRMTVEGEQVTNWVYEKEVAPKCDYPESGYGRQYIEFASWDKKGVPVTVRKAKNGGVYVYARSNKDLRLRAFADMERNYKTFYSEQSACDDGSLPVGENVPDEIGTNTCKVEGELEMDTGASITDVEDISYPTGIDPKDDPKAAFYFSADAAWGVDEDVTLPEACSQLGFYNADMTLTETQGEWAGMIPPVGGVLKAKELLGGKKKTVKVELSDGITYPNQTQTWGGPPSTIGKTVIDVTLKFKRAGK